MRTVFNSRYEVAHLWAHQLQDEARYSGGNFYFDGDTIYSYGSHFPCGRIVHNRNGQQAYILNSNSYSNSTSRHQSETLGSIPGYATIFYTPQCQSPKVVGKLNCDYTSAVKYVLRQLQTIISLMGKHKRARIYDYTTDIYDCCLNIRRWITFWELDKKQKWNVMYNGSRTAMMPTIFDYFSSKLKYEKWELTDKELAECVECWNLFNANGMFTDRHNTAENPMNYVIQSLILSWFGEEWQQRLETQNKKMQSLAKRRTEMQRKKAIKDCLERLDKWHNHKTCCFDANGAFKQVYHWHTALRISDDHIETSKGIHLTFDEAKRLWSVIQAFEKGMAFRHDLALDMNGHKWTLNSYENHILRAGCHLIPFSECQRIAEQMGW